MYIYMLYAPPDARALFGGARIEDQAKRKTQVRQTRCAMEEWRQLPAVFCTGTQIPVFRGSTEGESAAKPTGDAVTYTPIPHGQA
jgi:hypothetical protein